MFDDFGGVAYFPGALPFLTESIALLRSSSVGFVSIVLS